MNRLLSDDGTRGAYVYPAAGSDPKAWRVRAEKYPDDEPGWFGGKVLWGHDKPTREEAVEVARDWTERGVLPADRSRPLTLDERIWARHLLQVLSEAARPVRRAMDPQEGVRKVTAGAWEEQWRALKEALDDFTEGVLAGRPVTMVSGLGGKLGGDRPPMTEGER